MPSITLVVTTAEATRITNALAGTGYPQTAAGIKSWLMDYVSTHVKEYERKKGEKDAIAVLAAPADVTIT